MLCPSVLCASERVGGRSLLGESSRARKEVRLLRVRGDSPKPTVRRTLYSVTNQSEQPQNPADNTADPAAHNTSTKGTNAAGATDPAAKPKLGGQALKDVLIYGALRLLLFIVLTFIIHSAVILLGMANFFPLLISMVLALLVALPLSMLIFKKQRLRATNALYTWDAGRREHKQQMRRQLEERLDG